MTILNIKELRKSAGLTQIQLGQQVGVGQASVSEWEAGTQMPRVELLPTLAKALGVTIDKLFVSDQASA